MTMNSKKLTESQERQLIYLEKITGAFNEMFDPESKHYLGVEQISEDPNFTDFLHVLANVAPTQIFNKLTGMNMNYLQFNHQANQLCFQFMKSESDE